MTCVTGVYRVPRTSTRQGFAHAALSTQRISHKPESQTRLIHSQFLDTPTTIKLCVEQRRAIAQDLNDIHGG